MGSYGSMSGTGQDAGQGMKEEVRQKGEQAVEQVKQATGDAVSQARESTRAMLDGQKGRAAEGLGSVAAALRVTGQQLSEQDQGPFGQYAERAAEKVDAIASQLRDKSVDELMYEAERFARREPELFLGGAVVLGLLAARFLKASNSRRREMRHHEWSGTYGGPGGYAGAEYGQRYAGSTYRGEEGLAGRTHQGGETFAREGFGSTETYTGQTYREAGFSSSGTEDFGTSTSDYRTSGASQAEFERTHRADDADEAGTS